MKHLLHNPAYRMACDQFDAVADFLNLPETLRERTKLPKRLVTVSLPVKMDTGEGARLRGASRCSTISRSERRKAGLR